MTTETIANLFDAALKRYQDGEGADTLLPVFKEICDRSPKLSSAWCCLSWLYLLNNQPELAYKAAYKAFKLDAFDPQTRINLAIAMLETKKPGVREHIDMAQQLIDSSEELKEQSIANFADGLNRNPDWTSLKKVQNWIFN